MKFYIFLVCFISCALFVSSLNNYEKSTEVTYMAAVLEYEAYNVYDPVEYGYKVVRENARIIANYSTIAKELGVDIIVAPEYGIHSLDNDLTNYLTYTQYVPEKGHAVSPCVEGAFPQYSEAIEILSCAAMQNSIYIVADVAELNPCSDATISAAPTWGGYTVDEDCPNRGYYFHNTQVVFDRTGTVIARYRKQHLYLEPEFTPGTFDNSLAVFETDFGVTFTLQICFDLMFETPGYYNVKFMGIQDVAMSTAWVDLLPFGIADAAQDSWSRTMKANLLVSGYHWPEKSKLGSGIYNAYKEQEANYIYDKDSGNVMIYGAVTTKLTVPIPSPPKRDAVEKHVNPILSNDLSSQHQEMRDERYHEFVYIDLTLMGSILLNPTVNGEQDNAYVCSKDGELCCTLNYQYTGDLYYRLFAESGTIDVGNGETLSIGAQICMITWCLDKDNITSCGLGNVELPEPDVFGPFDMTSTFIAREVFPVGLKKDLQLVSHYDLQFVDDFDTYTLSSYVAIEDPFTLTLFGRWIANDP